MSNMLWFTFSSLHHLTFQKIWQRTSINCLWSFWLQSGQVRWLNGCLVSFSVLARLKTKAPVINLKKDSKTENNFSSVWLNGFQTYWVHRIDVLHLISQINTAPSAVRLRCVASQLRCVHLMTVGQFTLTPLHLWSVPPPPWLSGEWFVLPRPCRVVCPVVFVNLKLKQSGPMLCMPCFLTVSLFWVMNVVLS